jgi:hypothetical protein
MVKFRVPHLIAVVLTVIGVAMAPAPAYAADTCESGRVCMWEDAGFGGDRYVNELIADDSDGTGYNIDWWHGDNEISSVKNASNRYVCIYPGDYTWGGGEIVIPPNSESDNLGRDHGFDNNAESYKVTDSPLYGCN